MTFDIWPVTHDRWQLTAENWLMTHDEHYLKISALMLWELWCFEYLEEQAFCRTAPATPATPGLSNSIIKYSIVTINSTRLDTRNEELKGEGWRGRRCAGLSYYNPSAWQKELSQYNEVFPCPASIYQLHLSVHWWHDGVHPGCH